MQIVWNYAAYYVASKRRERPYCFLYLCYLFQSQVIRHMATEQCLNIGQFPEGLSLVLTQCSASVTQRWVIEHFKYERLAPQVQIGLAEWEKLTNL